MSNILLAGGRKLLREGLLLLLEGNPDLNVVAEAEEVSAVPKLLRALTVDVAIIAESAAATVGIRQVAEIMAANPKLRVMLLALNPPMQWLWGVLEAGALGCLTKECCREELLSALETVRQGRVYLSPSLVQLVISSEVRPDATNRSSNALAPREREILRRLSEGHITKQIAHDLGIGTKTVETHRRRIMAKLNVFTVAELTKHAIRQGLTTLETSV